MPAAFPGIGANTIGTWDVTQLVKFIKDILENQPPTNFSTIKAQQIAVSRKLVIADEIEFTKNPNFHTVGVTGEPAFTNTWANWGAPYFDVGFWKDPLGFVHLRGTLKSGTVGSVAFTLPPGYRPEATAGPFIVLSNNAVGRVETGADGAVTPIAPSSNVFVTLDGIRFKAA